MEKLIKRFRSKTKRILLTYNGYEICLISNNISCPLKKVNYRGTGGWSISVFFLMIMKPNYYANEQGQVNNSTGLLNKVWGTIFKE